MRPENSLLLCPEDSETQVSWSLEVCNQGNKGDSTCLPLTSACRSFFFFFDIGEFKHHGLKETGLSGAAQGCFTKQQVAPGLPSLGCKSYYRYHSSLSLYSLPLCLLSFHHSVVKNLPVMQETQVQSLGWEDPLKEEMATHSSTLAWKILWTEEPGGLQFTESQGVGYN